MKASHPKVSAALRLTVLLLLSSWAMLTTAAAHQIRPSVADVRIEGDRVTLRVDMTLETVLAGVDASSIADTNDSPASPFYDQLRDLDPDELEAQLKARWPLVASYFVVEADGKRAKLELGQVAIPPRGDTAIPRDSTIEITADLPPGGPVTVGAIPAFGPLILRHVGAGADAFAGLLAPGELSPPLPRSGGGAESGLVTFGRYVLLGAEHIVPEGLDHILFVLGLFFFALRVRPLLMQVTAFTAAHTVTLALATLKIVSVPSSVVEPLIAASIVFVAVENLLSDTYRPFRTVVVFCFGLLHGLGFASVLGDIGLGEGRFLVSLVGFNLGVELGQLTVITSAFLIVALPFGRRPWYRLWIARPASVAIAATGAFWFVQRVFF